MRYLDHIRDAIYVLIANGVQTHDIRVCYSRIIKHKIDDEISAEISPVVSKYFKKNFPGGDISEWQTIKYEGVEFRSDYPFNKIVVYSVNCCFFPQLLIEIASFPT